MKEKDRKSWEKDELPEIDLDLDDIEKESLKEEDEDGILKDLSSSLGQQVSDEMGLSDEYPLDEGEDMAKKPKKKRKALKIFGVIMLLILAFAVWLIATESGREFGIRRIVDFFYDDFKKEPEVTPDPLVPTKAPIPEGVIDGVDSEGHRITNYVKNYLIAGFEHSNSDSMMIVSINTKDDSIKITSLLRDTVVDIPGYKRNKLNSVYSRGGMDLLMKVIEDTYNLRIEGYATVDIDSFEDIVDILDGIDIELGQAETNYLNKEGYITNPKNRNLNVGWNHMNGNQAVGYCRVRFVSTLGGASNDYGRVVRQKRVLNAIFDKYKSLGVIDMVNVMKQCLGFIKTDLTEDQMTDVLVAIVENGITKMDSFRLPADGLFFDSGKQGYEGIKYGLFRDGHEQDNIDIFHQFIFLDPTPIPTKAPSDETGSKESTP